MEFKLNYPIEIAGSKDRVATLTFRRPTIADLKSNEKAGEGISADLDMISRLASITPEEVEAIDAQDYVRIGKILEGFLDPDQSIHENNH